MNETKNYRFRLGLKLNKEIKRNYFDHSNIWTTLSWALIQVREFKDWLIYTHLSLKDRASRTLGRLASLLCAYMGPNCHLNEFFRLYFIKLISGALPILWILFFIAASFRNFEMISYVVGTNNLPDSIRGAISLRIIKNLLNNVNRTTEANCCCNLQFVLSSFYI